MGFLKKQNSQTFSYTKKKRRLKIRKRRLITTDKDHKKLL